MRGLARRLSKRITGGAWRVYLHPRAMQIFFVLKRRGDKTSRQVPDRVRRRNGFLRGRRGAMDLVARRDLRREVASKAAHYSEKYGGVGTRDVEYEFGGPPNTNLGACISKYAKYSPKYFRIWKYRPYFAFLMGTAPPPTTTLPPSLLVPTTNRPPVSMPLGLLQMVSWLGDGAIRFRSMCQPFAGVASPPDRASYFISERCDNWRNASSLIGVLRRRATPASFHGLGGFGGGARSLICPCPLVLYLEMVENKSGAPRIFLLLFCHLSPRTA